MAAPAQPQSGGDMLLDLLSMDEPTATPAAAAAAPVGGTREGVAGGGSADVLLDLLGGRPGGPMQQSQPAGVPMGGGMMGGMNDLLGMGGVAPAAAPMQPQQQNAMAGLMGDVSGGMMAGGGGGMGMQSPMGGMMQQQQPSPMAQQQMPPGSFVAYEKGGLKNVFTLSKPGQQQNLTQVDAKFTCSISSALESFVFQAAVSKHCKIQMGPASAQVVPPNGSVNSNNLSRLLILNFLSLQRF